MTSYSGTGTLCSPIYVDCTYAVLDLINNPAFLVGDEEYLHDSCVFIDSHAGEGHISFFFDQQLHFTTIFLMSPMKESDTLDGVNIWVIEDYLDNTTKVATACMD